MSRWREERERGGLEGPPRRAGVAGSSQLATELVEEDDTGEAGWAEARWAWGVSWASLARLLSFSFFFLFYFSVLCFALGLK